MIKGHEENLSSRKRTRRKGFAYEPVKMETKNRVKQREGEFKKFLLVSSSTSLR